MRNQLDIPTHRLFAAADFLLAAIASRDGMHTVIPVSAEEPDDEAPLNKHAFTQMELVEAMSMLIRMGLVESVEPRRR